MDVTLNQFVPSIDQSTGQPITPKKVEGASVPEHQTTAVDGSDGVDAGGFVVGEVTDHAIDLHDIRPGEVSVSEGGGFDWLVGLKRTRRSECRFRPILMILR